MISDFLRLLPIVVPIFAVMLAGYGMRKAGVLTAEADRSLTRVVIVLLVPCLAFDAIIGNEALLIPANWLLPPIAGFGSVLLGIAVARLGVFLFRLPNGPVARTFAFTSSLQNYGYIPLPLCAAIFPRDTLGVLFAFSLGVELAFWTVALWQLTGGGNRKGWKSAINPPMLAIVAALVINGWLGSRLVPDALDTTFHMLGVCAVPMALLLSGGLIADHLRRDAFSHGWRVVGASVFVRILAVPAVLLLIVRALPLDDKLCSVTILQAAMPAAIFPLVVTKSHHGDIPTALQVILGTSLVGLLTIPLWIGLGLRWLGISL
ncbi:MAG: AEC family transporter [Terrimicrobiaceae bacterium]